MHQLEIFFFFLKCKSWTLINTLDRVWFEYGRQSFTFLSIWPICLLGMLFSIVHTKLDYNNLGEHFDKVWFTIGDVGDLFVQICSLVGNYFVQKRVPFFSPQPAHLTAIIFPLIFFLYRIGMLFVDQIWNYA